MKHFVYIFLVFTFLLACGERKNNKRINCLRISYKNDSTLSDFLGTPVDSNCYYFPDSLVFDTITKAINKRELEYRIIDRSYLLYKMREPILYNYNLHKEIYRITAIRSFHRPFCIRVEKRNDFYTLTIKMLDRNKGIPMILLEKPDSIIYPKDPILKYVKEFEIPVSKWNSLEALIDSSDFWTSKPRLDLNHLQIDGSTWIIEGQNQFGYQVKVLPSPRFQFLHTDININDFDLNDRYTNIFLFLFKTSEMTNEELY